MVTHLISFISCSSLCNSKFGTNFRSKRSLGTMKWDLGNFVHFFSFRYSSTSRSKTSRSFSWDIVLVIVTIELQVLTFKSYSSVCSFKGVFFFPFFCFSTTPLLLLFSETAFLQGLTSFTSSLLFSSAQPLDELRGAQSRREEALCSLWWADFSQGFWIFLLLQSFAKCPFLRQREHSIWANLQSFWKWPGFLQVKHFGELLEEDWYWRPMTSI